MHVMPRGTKQTGSGGRRLADERVAAKRRELELGPNDPLPEGTIIPGVVFGPDGRARCAKVNRYAADRQQEEAE